jgi:hypothetical protein
MKRVTTFLAAFAIAVAAAACSQTDSGVTSKIKASYAQDDLVQAHEIDVTTRGGVVTLTGEVPSMEARQQAVRLARETEGVTDVIDQLTVGVAATSGDADDIDVDVDVDDDLERGARRAGEAAREGAAATADAARKAGAAARDAVTDDDRDSDNDGK